MKRINLICLALLMVFSTYSTVKACSRIGEISPQNLAKSATLIVRATAIKYDRPHTEEYWTTGEPESTVEFHVEEVLKGQDVPDKIILSGYLSEKDDFNDVPVPYNFVRPGGRSGSCFANTYKRGAQFLLFLGKKREGEGYTPNIDALAPVNEQLHSADDPWVIWVRNYLKELETDRKAGRGKEVVGAVLMRLFGILSSAI